MAWTDSEVAQIRAAVLALATGTRVASVSYAGPPARTVSYGPTDLASLRALLAEGGKHPQVGNNVSHANNKTAQGMASQYSEGAGGEGRPGEEDERVYAVHPFRLCE